MPNAAWFALAAAIGATSAPAAAQVQALVDGRTQNVPAGVIRTITYTPGGRQTIHDEPYRGATAPGYATITTTETTDSNEDGSDTHTTVVTRIEPMAVTAVAYAPPIPAQTMVRTAPQGYAPAQAYQQAYPQQGYDPDAPEQTASYQEPQPPEGQGPYPPRPPQLAFDSGAYASGYGANDNDGPGQTQETGQGQVLRVHRDGMTGHFIAAVLINGVKLHAIIDTGAQTTMLSARDARACGADREIVRSTPMSGIGGTTMLNVARVHSMEIGGQSLGSFTAAIQADGIPYTLLGQTEIARLGRIVIENGVMTITPRQAQNRLAMR